MCRCDVILARSQHPRWTSAKCMKPMLPRKLTSSARINLNQHWNVLEDLVTCEISNHVTHHGRREDFGDTGLSNEINENLANEMLERDSADFCSSSPFNLISQVYIIIFVVKFQESKVLK